MSAREWLAVRGVELLAACFVAAVLRQSVLDLGARGIVLLGHSVRALFHLPLGTQLGPAPSR